MRTTRWTFGATGRACLTARTWRARWPVAPASCNEWNEPGVIRLRGRLCRELGVTALFHDTHYRVALDEGYRCQLGLEQFAHILAFSPSLAERYRGLGFDNVSVLLEAAATT